jgi:energy-coupling factor transport system ATP-binding protein
MADGWTVNPVIDVEKLSYTYPKNEEPTLRGINLTVERGELLVIMGPTGAGKTTFCLSLNGIIPHYLEGEIEGKITVAGISVLESSIQELVTKVGLVFQDPESQLFGVTVEEDISFGPCNFGLPMDEVRKRVKDAMAATRLSGYEKRETGNLSGGEKQRVALAGVLAIGPETLVLDEPTSELDPIGRQELMSVIEKMRKERKATIIMVGHNSEEVAKYADRIVIVKDGKIEMEGRPEEIFSKIEKLEDIGVRPPEICELFARLKKDGILPEGRPIPLSIEDASEMLKPILKKRGRRQKDVLVKPNASGPEKNEVIVEAKDLWHVYPGGVEALKGINLKIHKGDFLALLGQNGSGKTTLVKHFNGLLRPTKGEVFVKGENAKGKTVTELSKVIGYVFQNPDHQIFNSSVRDEIAYGLKNIGLSEEEIDSRVKKILRIIGLEGKERVFPFNLGKGERQKLAVGSVLAMEPEVLVIDEPTTGLDVKGINHIMALLQELHEKGKTIIIITHDMSIASKYAKRIVVLHNGKILLEGSPNEVYSKPEILERSSLHPPQITRLAQSLEEYGIPRDITSVEEFYKFIRGD